MSEARKAVHVAAQSSLPRVSPALPSPPLLSPGWPSAAPHPRGLLTASPKELASVGRSSVGETPPSGWKVDLKTSFLGEGGVFWVWPLAQERSLPHTDLGAGAPGWAHGLVPSASQRGVCPFPCFGIPRAGRGRERGPARRRRASGSIQGKRSHTQSGPGWGLLPTMGLIPGADLPRQRLGGE